MDPIANMFSIIKNGYAAGKQTVFVPHSKIKMEIAKLFQKNNYIKEIARRGKKSRKNLEITLFYDDKKPAVRDIRRVSKLSKRVYLSYREIYPIKGGRGLLIMSTPKGMLSGQEARQQKVGGEVMGEIW